MTIQQLRCFAVMAEEKHYTKAATRLHISQPSLSYSIAELEKELNMPLFERRDNRTCITEFGEKLLPHVQLALSKIDNIRIKAYELIDPLTGSVNLGIIYSLSFDFFPMLLEGFYADKENGNVTVSFFQGVSRVLTDKLMDGSLDIIISGEWESENVHRAYMFTQELKFVSPKNHPLAGKETVTLDDIKDERLISLGINSNINAHITQCFQSRGYHANFVMTLAECSAMGAFIGSNMGSAITPSVPSLNSNNVCIIPFAEEDRRLLGRKIYLQWAKDRYLPPTARRFCDFVLRKFGKQEE